MFRRHRRRVRGPLSAAAARCQLVTSIMATGDGGHAISVFLSRRLATRPPELQTPPSRPFNYAIVATQGLRVASRAAIWSS